MEPEETTHNNFILIDFDSNSITSPQPSTKMPKVGDKIKRKGGSALQTVTEVCLSGLQVWATYDDSGKDYYPQGQDLKDIIILTEEKGEEEMTNQLYEFKNLKDNRTVYGYKLATNSAGMWVMEEKGTGDTIAVDKKDVEEVIPYSVSVKFVGGGTTYSYTAKKDQFKIGDVLLLSSDYGDGLAHVTEVDTKSKRATKDLAEQCTAKLVVDTDFKN